MAFVLYCEITAGVQLSKSIWFCFMILIFSYSSVQVNEVKNSAAMELEGLKRSLQFLEAQLMDIKRIITDRHVQVKKYIREQHPNIEHRFDVWHVAKGMLHEVIFLAVVLKISVMS